MTKFSELGLAPAVLQALQDEGYETPTPIQAQAIPPLLTGADLLGIAQTGTGKTAAFALPLLTRIAADRRPAPRRGARVLVLSPTRELAAQIGESFRTYGRHLGVSVAVVFGGVAHRPQIDALSRGVDVLVATPGRLIDHLDTRAVTLEAVEALVLDEADQMLDLGFVRPIRRIVSHLRARRQNLFFSATMPHEIAALAAELLHEPVRVQVTPVATTAERVAQRVIHIEANKKRPLLVDLFSDKAMQRTLVFTRTKRGADRVARHLEEAGIEAAAIHGNKSQRQREVALDAFRNGKTGVLVATDIAARGIDIDAVTHVVNYELPEVPEAYVHRIGRTARAGAEGQAISLCDTEERDLLRAIERLTRQSIPAEDRRNDPSIVAVPRSRPSGGRDDGEGSERRERSGGFTRRGERGAGGERGHTRDRGDRSRRDERSEKNPRRGEAGRAGRSEERRGETRTHEPRRDERNGESRTHEPRRRDERNGESRVYEPRRRDERNGESRVHESRRDHEPRRHEERGSEKRAHASRSHDHRGAGSKERHAHRGAEGSGNREVPTANWQGNRPAPAGKGGRDERKPRDGRPDGEAVAHVFNGGKGRQPPRDRNHAGGHAGRGSDRSAAHKEHGSRSSGAPQGKPRRSNGGKGHRGANAGRRLVDA